MFSCQVADALTVYLDVTFPNGSKVSVREQHDIDEEGITFEKTTLSDALVCLNLSVVAHLSRNNTQLQCIGYSGGRRRLSNIASLLVYVSLRKLV